MKKSQNDSDKNKETGKSGEVTSRKANKKGKDGAVLGKINDDGEKARR